MRQDLLSPNVPRALQKDRGRRDLLRVATAASLALASAPHGRARAEEVAPVPAPTSAATPVPVPAPEMRAPFGLTWGMSSAEVKAIGVTLADTVGYQQYGRSFTATNLERVPGDVETVLLTFGFRDRLVRIAAFGHSEEGDPHGNRVTQRYNELRGLLTERYGVGQEVDWRDPTHLRSRDDYVMALHQGRARCYTTFQKPPVRVELSIRAPRFDEANYVIIYEFMPGTDELEADRKQAEREAL